MEEPNLSPPGFLSTLRSLGDSLLAGAHHRFELFAVELQEEKCRLVQTFILTGIALFAGAMAILFGSFTLVCLFWDTARLFVLGGLTVLYAGVLVAMTIWIRRREARQPSPFSATLREIEEDRICFRTES